MSYQKWLQEVKQLYFNMFNGILDDSNPVWFDLYCEGRPSMEAFEMTINNQHENRQ